MSKFADEVRRVLGYSPVMDRVEFFITWLRSLGVDDADKAADALEAYAKDAERYREIRDMLWGITLTENRQNWDLRISLRTKVDTVEEAVNAAIAASREKK